MSCDLRYLLCEKIIEKAMIENRIIVISLILRNKTKRKSIIIYSLNQRLTKKNK